MRCPSKSTLPLHDGELKNCGKDTREKDGFCLALVLRGTTGYIFPIKNLGSSVFLSIFQSKMAVTGSCLLLLRMHG